MVVRIRKPTLFHADWLRAFAVPLASLLALSAVLAFSITLWNSVGGSPSPKVVHGLLSAASLYVATAFLSRYISRPEL